MAAAQSCWSCCGLPWQLVLVTYRLSHTSLLTSARCLCWCRVFWVVAGLPALLCWSRHFYIYQVGSTPLGCSPTANCFTSACCPVFSSHCSQFRLGKRSVPGPRHLFFFVLGGGKGRTKEHQLWLGSSLWWRTVRAWALSAPQGSPQELQCKVLLQTSCGTSGQGIYPLFIAVLSLLK